MSLGLPISFRNLKGLYDYTVGLLHPAAQLTTQPPPPRAETPPSALLENHPSSPGEGDSSRRDSSVAGIAHMRRGSDNVTNQLTRAQAEVARLEERCRNLERTLKSTRDLLDTRDSELDRMKRAGNGVPSPPRAGTSEGRSHLRRHSRNEGSGTLSRASTIAASNAAMLAEEHRAQARSNETFMTRSDTWSGAQVIQAIHDLNSEIIQFAASATDLCTFDINYPHSPQANQDTISRLGPTFASLISVRERNAQDPTLVGLALQAATTTCIARAMGNFALGLPSKAEVALAQVYSHIFVTEAQPTSARWRALAHRHVHTLYPGLSEYAIEDLKETIVRWTSDILVAGGATHESASRSWVRDTFGEQVGRMAKSVAEITKICKEQIMSTNFDVILIDPGQFFDDRVMHDAFADCGDLAGNTVLATTELGLRRMTRKSVPGREEERAVEQQLLLKPKVILDSVASTFS